MKKKLAYLGAPSEVGACLRGAGLAPQALRDQGFVESLRGLGFLVEDKGDIKGPSFFEKRKDDRIHFLEENAIWGNLICNALRECYANGQVPLLVGGDHAVAMGSIAAAKEQAEKKGCPLHVLWFDAHGDFNTPETSPTGHVHGMPLAVVCGKGEDSLLNVFKLSKDPVIEKNITLVGARDIDEGEAVLLQASDMHQVSMEQIRTDGLVSHVESALNRAKEDQAHLHVSFDVDVIDSREAPATGTPVADGISIKEMAQAFQLIKNRQAMDSLDIVELNPLLDHENETAKKIKNLLLELFA